MCAGQHGSHGTLITAPLRFGATLLLLSFEARLRLLNLRIYLKCINKDTSLCKSKVFAPFGLTPLSLLHSWPTALATGMQLKSSDHHGCRWQGAIISYFVYCFLKGLGSILVFVTSWQCRAGRKSEWRERGGGGGNSKGLWRDSKHHNDTTSVVNPRPPGCFRAVQRFNMLYTQQGQLFKKNEALLSQVHIKS